MEETLLEPEDEQGAGDDEARVDTDDRERSDDRVPLARDGRAWRRL